MLTAVAAWSQTTIFHKGFLADVKYGAHIGYNIGGSAPLSMPASIRSLNKFPLALPTSTSASKCTNRSSTISG